MQCANCVYLPCELQYVIFRYYNIQTLLQNLLIYWMSHAISYVLIITSDIMI